MVSECMFPIAPEHASEYAKPGLTDGDFSMRLMELIRWPLLILCMSWAKTARPAVPPPMIANFNWSRRGGSLLGRLTVTRTTKREAVASECRFAGGP